LHLREEFHLPFRLGRNEVVVIKEEGGVKERFEKGRLLFIILTGKGSSQRKKTTYRSPVKKGVKRRERKGGDPEKRGNRFFSPKDPVA